LETGSFHAARPGWPTALHERAAPAPAGVDRSAPVPQGSRVRFSWLPRFILKNFYKEGTRIYYFIVYLLFIL
jgi:hypothetical protein